MFKLWFCRIRGLICLGLLSTLGLAEEAVFPLEQEKEQTASSIKGWTENYETALAAAKSENKNLLLLFTGSDWCGYCIVLEREVFSTSKFKNWAGKNVILVKFDFPKTKKQSDKIKSQNEKLQSEFKPNGYPGVFLVSPEGKVLAKMGGYEVGSGPAKYLKRITEQYPGKDSEIKSE